MATHLVTHGQEVRHVLYGYKTKKEIAPKYFQDHFSSVLRSLKHPTTLVESQLK